MTGRRRSSLTSRIALTACALVTLAVVAAVVLSMWFQPLAAAIIVIVVMLPLTISIVPRRLSAMSAMFRAMAGTVTSYRDGDFAFSLAWNDNDELGDLVTA